MAPQVNSTKHTKKKLYQFFSNSSKKLKKKEYSQRHSVRPPISLIPKPDKIPPRKKITGQHPCNYFIFLKLFCFIEKYPD